jgi:L-threonylcarbamoyladenylate synthase
MKILHAVDNPEVTTLLLSGAVGVLPTDTVYGLVCRAADTVAVERLYKLKSREHKPGTIIAATIDQLVDLGLKARYLKAVVQFWPGAISVQIPHQIDYLNLGTGRQAVRIPDDNKLQKLLLKTGPLQTTSANLPGEPVAGTVKEAQDYFDDRIDFYVDGGDLSNRAPSTILRIVDDAIEVVRPGAVAIDENGRRQP